MTSLMRVTISCLAALALIAASGCGSSTKSSNDYVNAINKVQTDFAANVSKVGSAPSTGTDPQAAAQKTFTDLKTAIDKAIADLKGVTPPDKVKTLHGQLVSEMQNFDNEVKAAGDSLASKDPKKILAAQTKFASAASSVGSQIAGTIDAINKKLHS